MKRASVLIGLLSGVALISSLIGPASLAGPPAGSDLRYNPSRGLILWARHYREAGLHALARRRRRRLDHRVDGGRAIVESPLP
jgi:hypothetical protein